MFALNKKTKNFEMFVSDIEIANIDQGIFSVRLTDRLMCVCVCVCVSKRGGKREKVRERERERERESESEHKR